MDLTAFLRAHFAMASDDPALENVLRAQSTCERACHLIPGTF